MHDGPCPKKQPPARDRLAALRTSYLVQGIGRSLLSRVRSDILVRMEGSTGVIWSDARSAGRIASIVRDAGLRVLACGAARPGEIDPSVSESDIKVFDDLRATLLSEKPTVFLLAAPSPDRSLDARTLGDLRSAGTRVLTCVAPSGGMMGASEAGLLAESGGALPVSAFRLVPRIRRHPAFVRAEDVLEAFGRADVVTVEAFCPPAWGGLSAALPLAIDAVLTVFGTPELADAAGTTPAKKLDELSGTLAALLRFPDGRAGQISVSDRGAWGWRITLAGNEGRLTIRPSGFDWLGPDGAKRDDSRVDPGIGSHEGVLGAALQAAASGAMSGEPGVDWIGVLSTAEAVLLSSRTGQSESPATLARASVGAGI